MDMKEYVRVFPIVGNIGKKFYFFNKIKSLQDEKSYPQPCSPRFASIYLFHLAQERYSMVYGFDSPEQSLAHVWCTHLDVMICQCKDEGCISEEVC